MNKSLRTIGSGLIGAAVAIALLAVLRVSLFRPTTPAPQPRNTPQARSAPGDVEIVPTSPDQASPTPSPIVQAPAAGLDPANLEITAPVTDPPAKSPVVAQPTPAPIAALHDEPPTETASPDALIQPLAVRPPSGGKSTGNYLEHIPPADGIDDAPADGTPQTPPPTEEVATGTKQFRPNERNYLELIPPATEAPSLGPRSSSATVTNKAAAEQPRIPAPDAPVPLPPPEDDRPSELVQAPQTLPATAPDTRPAVLARTESDEPHSHADAPASTTTPATPTDRPASPQQDQPPKHEPSPQRDRPVQRSVASARDAIAAKTPASSPKDDTPPAEAARAAMQAGDKALAAGQTDEALRQFRRAHQLDPENAEVLRGWAMALLVKQDFTQAVDVYRRLTELRPNDRTARYNFALALMREGEFFQAEEVYRQLLRDEPDLLDARVNLALLYQSQGKLTWAREQWEAVLQRDDESGEAHALLAEVLLDLNRREEAMRHFARAAALQPNVASAWLNYAGAAAEVGSVGRAVAAMQRALHLAPQDAEAWRMLGDLKMELYRATNDTAVLAEAITAWEQSLILDATQTDLARRIELYKPLTKNTTVGPTRP